MRTCQFTRFDVNDLKINKYVFIQYDFMYEYSSNGNWSACVGNYILNYNSLTRRKIMRLRKNKLMSLYSFKEVMDDTDKVIGMMKETVDKLNEYIQ